MLIEQMSVSDSIKPKPVISALSNDRFGFNCFLFTEFLFKLFHKGSDMLKKSSIPSTKIIQPWFSCLCPGKTVSRALPMACKLPFALLAL